MLKTYQHIEERRKNKTKENKFVKSLNVLKEITYLKKLLQVII